MADAANGKLGTARFYAMVFGTAYLGISLVELFYGAEDPLQVGDAVILQRTVLQSLTHFAVAFTTLGSFIAGEPAARSTARVIGALFVALTVWGFASPSGLGGVFGYTDDIPLAYNVLHALTAAAALYAGFAGERSTRRPSPTRTQS